jgi:hypothetical protein
MEASGAAELGRRLSSLPTGSPPENSIGFFGFCDAPLKIAHKLRRPRSEDIEIFAEDCDVAHVLVDQVLNSQHGSYRVRLIDSEDFWDSRAES